MEFLTASLVGWSRAQFAMTAMYHWVFVPLTLGLGIIMAVMETLYVRTGKEEWKSAARFWMRLFGINFAFGIATGLVLEFQFGTNWSNYSWFVGDIFGAPLAIEAILAFFMEATFISLMFFGWKKLSRGGSPCFHVAHGSRSHHFGVMDTGGQRLDAVSGRDGVQSRYRPQRNARLLVDTAFARRC